MVASVQFHRGPGLQPAPIGYIEAIRPREDRGLAASWKGPAMVQLVKLLVPGRMITTKPGNPPHSAQTATLPIICRDDREYSTLRGAIFPKVLANFLFERRNLTGARLARGVAPCRR